MNSEESFGENTSHNFSQSGKPEEIKKELVDLRNKQPSQTQQSMKIIYMKKLKE
jgi:hypothetical protein